MQNLCHGITDLEGEASLSCVTRALGVCSKDLCSVSRAAHQDKQCWCFLTGQLAQTKKRPVSGVHLLLAPILLLERVLVPDRSGKISAQFPVSLYLQIKTDSHIHALIKPDREHTT